MNKKMKKVLSVPAVLPLLNERIMVLTMKI